MSWTNSSTLLNKNLSLTGGKWIKPFLPLITWTRNKETKSVQSLIPIKRIFRKLTMLTAKDHSFVKIIDRNFRLNSHRFEDSLLYGWEINWFTIKMKRASLQQPCFDSLLARVSVYIHPKQPSRWLHCHALWVVSWCNCSDPCNLATTLEYEIYMACVCMYHDVNYFWRKE